MSYAGLVTRHGQLHVKLNGSRRENPEYREVIKGWESFGGQYWFAVDYEEDTGRYFGLVQGPFEELGYWTEGQLKPLIQEGKVWEIREGDLPHAGRRS